MESMLHGASDHLVQMLVQLILARCELSDWFLPLSLCARVCYCAFVALLKVFVCVLVNLCEKYFT
jgi:hypothetical protein